MLESGLVLYVALIFIFVFWRLLCPWWFCGRWLQFANYCSLLYAVCFVNLAYNCYTFVSIAITDEGREVWHHLTPWMKPFTVSMPIGIFFVFFMCGSQTVQHVDFIRRREATGKHDRVVQIIALPVVYGTMTVATLVRMYEVAAQLGPAALAMTEEHAQMSDLPLKLNLNEAIRANTTRATEAVVMINLSKTDTNYMVADLYEAWALYQFLKLTIELIAAGIEKKSKSKISEEKAAGEAFKLVHSAVNNLAWLGVVLFMVTIFLQTGWSLYLLTLATDKTQWNDWHIAMAQFEAAGTVASSAAIWNVSVVETSFHIFLEDFAPLLKFITVKILVTFAFFQRGIFGVLKTVEATMPDAITSITAKVPIIADILRMNPVEFEMFYASLLGFECLFVAILHWLAWGPKEVWYEAFCDEDEQKGNEDVEKAERQPLRPYISSASSP